jgi:uncharacterized protein YigE (DUF2233 family)
MTRLRRILLLTALLASAGLCVGAGFAAPPERTPDDPACWRTSFEGDGFVVCLYRRGQDRFELALDGPRGPLGSLPALKRHLGAAAVDVRFAMNAGMFEPDQRPVGLFVQAGKVQTPLRTADGSGNFYLKPNGVFVVATDGSVRIEETSVFDPGRQVQWATQSGPLLVDGGRLHPRIAENGTSLTVRNGVGVRSPDEALFVISDGPVSFGRLARFYRDALDCPDALYLDGTISSLWAPGLGRLDRRGGLGPLVVVRRGGPDR